MFDANDKLKKYDRVGDIHDYFSYTFEVISNPKRLLDQTKKHTNEVC